MRLLTLTGPGGVGKTRLALEAARAVEGGLRRRRALRLARRAAEARGCAGGDRQDARDRRALGRVCRPGRRALPGRQAPAAGASTTSSTCWRPRRSSARCSLPVPRSRSWPPAASRSACTPRSATPCRRSRCPRATMPEDADALAGVDAVALFCERARAHDPDFDLGDANAAAVAEICRRVDGLPLAIELAAARCGLLSPGEIAERLRRRARRAGRRRPRRARTPADAARDHRLEPRAAQRRREAVLRALRGVRRRRDGARRPRRSRAPASTRSTRLVAKSLLVRRQRRAHAHPAGDARDDPRLRRRALRAPPPTSDAVRERHYRYYLALAQRHGTERALWGADSQEHLARLDAEIDNLHAALGWAVGQARRRTRRSRWCAALGWYWVMRNRYADAVDWIDQALSMPGADAHPALRVRALCTRPGACGRSGAEPSKPRSLAEAEAIARELGDPADPVAKRSGLRVHVEASAGAASTPQTRSPTRRCRWADSRRRRHGRSPWRPTRRRRLRPRIAELRERVDRAASLLEEVGNVYRPREPARERLATRHCARQRSRRKGASSTARLRSRVSSTVRSSGCSCSGNLGLAALLTGDTDTARARVPRGAQALPRTRRPPRSHLKASGALPRSPWSTATPPRRDTRRRRRRTPLRRTRMMRVDARLETAFFEPARTRHGADAWDAAAREGGGAELRGRDRLRPRRTAHVDPDRAAERSRNASALHASVIRAGHNGRHDPLLLQRRRQQRPVV